MSSKRFLRFGAQLLGEARTRNLCVALAAALVLPSWSAPAMSAPARRTKRVPPAEEVNLWTDDGLQLKATFFPGTKGKESVPVILLHMWKGNRAEYRHLAPYLQSKGHAVLVPDLRGHGGSAGPKPERISLPVLVGMVTGDMETLKRFLMRKNNAAELNINKLCIVGAEMGAAVALDYARLDWSWPPLASGKQGQDVKAIVLISPQASFRGLNVKQALAHPAIRSLVSVMIMVGKRDARAVREAQRLHKMFARYRPDQSPSQKNLFYGEFDTNAKGTQMLGKTTIAYIEAFIQRRAASQPYPWEDRKKDN